MKKGIGPRQLGSPLKQTMTEKSKKYYPQEESKYEQIGQKDKHSYYKSKELGGKDIVYGPPMQEGTMGPGFGGEDWQPDYGKGAEGWVYNEKTGRLGAMTEKTVNKPLGYKETTYDVEWDRRPKAGKVEVPRKKGSIKLPKPNMKLKK